MSVSCNSDSATLLHALIDGCKVRSSGSSSGDSPDLLIGGAHFCACSRMCILGPEL